MFSGTKEAMETPRCGVAVPRSTIRGVSMHRIVHALEIIVTAPFRAVKALLPSGRAGGGHKRVGRGGRGRPRP